MATDFEHRPGAKTLVVIFHGIGSLVDRLAAVVKATEDEFGETADVLMPKRWSGFFSNADPVDITRDAVLQVEGLVRDHGYERIVVVGYSAGGIIARKFLIYAMGEQREAPFEERADVLRTGRSWAPKIERIVLLAGMNRGWQFAPTVNPFRLAAGRVLYFLLRIFPGLHLFASLRRGAPFVADLRNQWLSLSRAGLLKNLIVVQLLGTIDDVVSPEDNVDTETGSDFFYLDVPGSGHDSVREFDKPPYGEVRRAAYLSALRDSREVLATKHLPPPPPDYAVDDTVEHVLFVIHGIRDHGFWTAHLARHVVDAARRQGVRVVALTPSYGYFAMLPFLLPATRGEKVRWFMEQYTEALARFPNAKSFSYIGHSNGTYLLAGALKRYRTCHFDRVLFAGSVVRSDFSWQRLIAANRVRAVLNYVADGDWVVALFPRFLARLGADVGGAGWDGFTPGPPNPQAPVNDIEYVVGSHFTALREQNWDDIARFIVSGQLPPHVPAKNHNPWIRAIAAVSILVWILLIAVVLAPPLVLLAWPAGDLVSWSLGGRAFASFLWMMFMKTVLTRF